LGVGLCVAGIFAVAKPSGLALAWSGAWLTVDGTAASFAASGTVGVFELSGDGTAPTATATPRPARAAATPAPTARPPRRGFCC
jgi:hypothetical protein